MQIQKAEAFTLPDFSDGCFKTRAYCQLVPAEGELRDKILSNAKASHLFDDQRDRWDLFPLYSILVSAGWNKNTDVFDPIELWQARHSPEDKLVNEQHDQKKIIGHITKNITVGEDLKPVPEDTKEEDLPYRLHIITSSVLYKVWEDKSQQKNMDRLIASIQNGELSVSMECLFKGFDFALINKSTGEHRLLPRNDETSFLTKKLRQYGGSGEYQNYSVGRLLRSITFSAQGIVSAPANPDSIISPSLNIFDKSNANFQKSVYINLDQLKENPKGFMESTMAENTQAKTDWDVTGHPFEKETEEKHPLNDDAKAYENLKTRYSKLEASFNELKGKLEQISAKTVADLEAKLSEATKAKEDMEKEKDKMDEDCKAAKASLEKTQADLESETKTREAYEAATRKANRTQALFAADKSLTKEKVEKLVADFSDVHDSTFAAMVETLKGYAERAPKPITSQNVLATAKVEDMGTTNAPVEDTAKAFINQVKDAFTKGAK